MSRLLAFAAVATVLAGCGGGSSQPVNPNTAESSPPGDIPDNQAYVRYAPPNAGYSVKVPEGWARTSSGGAVTFTDKLNSIRMESARATSPPTVASVKSATLPQLAKSVKSFQPGGVTIVKRQSGPAVRVTYRSAAPTSAVTGRSGQDDVERYLFFHRGRAVTLTLSGPKGADNVDPWRLVTDSLQWSP